jgi:hypothetical protein
MASSLSKQIEAEFARLPPDEQLSLLERLVQEFRVGGWGQRGFPDHVLRDLAGKNPELDRLLKGLRPDAEAAQGDLLNEGY